MALAPNRRARRAREAQLPKGDAPNGTTPTRRLDVAEVLLKTCDGQTVLDPFGRLLTLHVVDYAGGRSKIGFDVRTATLRERLAYALRPRPLTAERWRS